MTVDELINQGDLEGALALLREQTAGPQPNPEHLLTAFRVEVRLQRFEGAEGWMRRLIESQPAAAQAMGALLRTARAEAKAAARLVDPAVAGKRAALGAPPPHGLVFVKAAVLHAQKDYAGAAAALAEAKGSTPAVAGTLTWIDGRKARFVDLTDSDDLTGPILPGYEGDTVLDLPYSQLRSVSFLDPRTNFDLMWIPAEVVPAAGQPLRVRVPAFYPGSGKAAIPEVRSGQMTTWERAHGYAQGFGQRDFKVSMQDGGVSMVGIWQILRIDFDGQAAAQPEKPKGFWKKLFG
jgi:protein involved in temperature-dependent protein secretion